MVWVFSLPEAANNYAISGVENTQKQYRSLPLVDYTYVHEISPATIEY